MAEAALITPLFIFLLFGTIEFGGLFRDYLTINDATNSGARGAAIAGNVANADWLILQGIKSSTGALTKTGIQKIIIYEANDSTSTVPANCKALSASPPSGITQTDGSCNVYNSAALNLAQSPHFGNCTAPDSYQRFWCPTSRKYAAKADAGNGPPDFLGVYIEFDHHWWTGMFGDQFTITSTTVTRLEPSSLL